MIRWVELTVFAVLFLVVTVLGFVASRWRAGATLEHLDEWGLGGRQFGAWITWFLIGGDIYTAYTFVAVPALLFGAGAVGFYAMSYTLVLYPLVFLPVLRMWSVSRVHGYVTPADFVRARYDSPLLALLVAITGLVATMPYIALQLVGMEAVLRTMGLNGTGIAGHLPLLVAFVILAVYTYQSGLRAPALIAFVKDALIYLTHRAPDEPSFSAAAIVDRVAPLPLAAIHSTHDEFVPVADVERVLRAANEPKRLLIVNASNHRFSDNLDEFDRQLLEAIAWVKAHAPR